LRCNPLKRQALAS
jgi:hypothetical protein